MRVMQGFDPYNMCAWACFGCVAAFQKPGKALTFVHVHVHVLVHACLQEEGRQRCFFLDSKVRLAQPVHHRAEQMALYYSTAVLCNVVQCCAVSMYCAVVPAGCHGGIAWQLCKLEAGSTLLQAAHICT